MFTREEHEHAIIFLNYILMRGGHVRVPMVKPPDNPEWKNVTKTFETAIQLESEVKEVCMNGMDENVPK